METFYRNVLILMNFFIVKIKMNGFSFCSEYVKTFHFEKIKMFCFHFILSIPFILTFILYYINVASKAKQFSLL